MCCEYPQSNHRLLVYSPLTDISDECVRQSSESILYPQQLFSKKFAKTKILLPHPLPSIRTNFTSFHQQSYALADSFLCPWNSPGKNTGVDSHSLLQGIFLTQGSNPGLLHDGQILYYLSHHGSPLQCIMCVKINSIFPSGLSWWVRGKESACQAGDAGLIPGLERSPGKGNYNPLQCSCLVVPLDGGNCQATVHGVTRAGHDLATRCQRQQIFHSIYIY